MTYAMLVRIARLPISHMKKFKIVTYAEQLKNNQEGFRLQTGQLITSNTFQELLENIGKYFLLIVQTR